MSTEEWGYKISYTSPLEKYDMFYTYYENTTLGTYIYIRSIPITLYFLSCLVLTAPNVYSFQDQANEMHAQCS